MLAVGLFVVLLFATCLAEQKSKLLVQSNMDQSHFSGPSGSRIPVPLNKMVDSSYLVGPDAEVAEHLSSTQNSSMQIKIPRVPMV